MALDLGTLSGTIDLNDRPFNAAAARVDAHQDRMRSKFHALRAAAGIALAAAAATVVKFGSDSVKAYAEAQTSQGKLQDAFARFPKLADTNIGALRNLNTELAKKTKYDDDATASGQAVLAQFKLTGGQITELTPLLQDYASKTGKDLPTAARDLGKAVMGQGRGLKAVGINFKDTGDHTKNLEQITKGLRTQVGGFAEKEGARAEGQAAILSNQFGELEETAGSKLLPTLMRLTGGLIQAVGWMQNNTAIVKPLAIGLGALAAVMFAVSAGTKIAAVSMKIASVATKAWAAAQWLINAAMSANPIGIIIVLLAALVGGLIIAYKRSETFRNIVNAALHGAGAAFMWLWARAKDLFGWFKGHWGLMLAIITGPIGLAVRYVYRHWGQIRAAFSAAVRWVGSVFKAGWALLRNYVVDPVVRAWNYLSAWSARIRALLGAILGWVASNFRRGWARIEGWMRGPIDAARTAIGRIIDGVKRIFSDGVNRIGIIWDRLKAKAKAPVAFIINTVINGGLLKGYNWVAGKLGLNTIDPIKIKGFKTGGPTGVGGDNQVAGVVHSNEHVATADEVRRAGGHGTWERLRAMARAGMLRGFFLGGQAPVPGHWNRHSGYRWARWAGDNPGPVGRPVHAWKSGVIAAVKLITGSYGRHIIENAGGARAYYAHLASANVHAGQHVTAGQVIAHTGGARGARGSGNSTGPHLHFEIRGGSAAIGGNSGAGGAVAAAKPSWLGKFSSAVTLLKSKISGGLGDLKSLGNSPWADLVKAVPNKIVDAMIEKVKTAWHTYSTALGPAATFNPGGGSNRSIGQRLMLQRWPAGQWGALNNLWTRESGWRTTARNPSSGAYGIPQALPGSKMASAGSDWRSNPATQIRWGLGYIAGRYGTPAGAWAHSQRTGWYANGTPSAAGGFGWTSEKGAELVVNPQLRKFSGGETVYDAKQTKKMLGGLGAQVQQVNHFPTVMDPRIAAEAAGQRLTATLKANGW